MRIFINPEKCLKFNSVAVVFLLLYFQHVHAMVRQTSVIPRQDSVIVERGVSREITVMRMFVCT